ncbi:M90 family metallopeptidase [Adhaeribacter pallidiroseus]|uniref:Protein MtfA n=1 Tax=Adhaeribacter pallidiroseus TaxID=2072847 RepID=A0A369QP26_9BACT|nr:M90 family metallopeptidase [Adhaeribacter pallidiroseus]RDC63968.1 Protein MtfA [Adhaeribacter pallidiroseus]
MHSDKQADFTSYYQQVIKQQQKTALLLAGGLMLFMLSIGIFSKALPAFILGAIGLLLIFMVYRHYTRKYFRRLALIGKSFPDNWHQYLESNATFYAQLNQVQKQQFQTRVQFFLAEKKIEGIETSINDEIRLLVAASAIIPTFAFPFYDYSNLRQVLLYSNSFNQSFDTENAAGENRNIAGMVGNGFLNGTLLLSKPDLVAGFKGKNLHNVGIHEFVHLLDMADGAVDGLPEIFLAHSYAVPWLQVIQAEVRKIRKGKSDINPYGLTNNAEFLAVVSEYFFDNPEKMEAAHPELYQYLCTIFHQNPA